MSGLPRNLNGRSMSRRYDRLAGEERFRLALEATARGDDLELGRLRDAAPMRHCRITDPEYMDRVDASRRLAFALALLALPLVAELRGLLRALVEHADEPTSDAVPTDVLTGIADAMAAYQAFALVCRERMELEPGVVLRAHLDPLVNVDDLEKLESPGAEPEAVERWAEVMHHWWAEALT